MLDIYTKNTNISLSWFLLKRNKPFTEEEEKMANVKLFARLTLYKKGSNPEKDERQNRILLQHFFRMIIPEEVYDIIQSRKIAVGYIGTYCDKYEKKKVYPFHFSIYGSARDEIVYERKILVASQEDGLSVQEDVD